MSAIDLVLSLVNRPPGSEYDYSAKVEREAGSNCSESVVLVDYEGNTVCCSSISGVVFGTGKQCHTMSDKWLKIKEELGLPREFTWETAILVTAARLWTPWCLSQPEYLMSAWAYLLVDPSNALGIYGPKAELPLSGTDQQDGLST